MFKLNSTTISTTPAPFISSVTKMATSSSPRRHHHPAVIRYLLYATAHLLLLPLDVSPSTYNVTVSNSNNRTSRQIDDLLLSQSSGGTSASASSSSSSSHLTELDSEQQQQPANNEQPFATFVYSALINDKVQLPCDINPPSSDDQMLLVLWYKDDQLAPILTLDGRKNSADSSATISLPHLQGRAYFSVHSHPAHLLIDPVAASDEGDYRCRVDFRKARTVNTVISLKVITPPQVPKILDSDGNALSGVVGPYNEGDELTLTCLTKGGKPRPSLIWWRDYAIIDDSFEFDDRDVTTNELTIPRLARHHLLALVMCQAINSNITGPASNSITLDINLKPTEVRITQLTPILVAGSEALFECNTFGSRPMPAIYWRFDGRKYETRIHGEQQTTSTLTLRFDRHHRGLTVECIVENLRIPGSALRDQLVLDVQYPPQLSLKLGAPSLSLDAIQEGIDIYFDCHVDANPPPTTPITWLFNGQPLLPEPGVIESNQSLVLQRVQRWRNGTYQCTCSNNQGTVISNEIELEIKFSPVCATPFTLIYGLNLNEHVQIVCNVESRPAKASFSWKFEKTTNLASFVQLNDSKSILEYVPRHRDQYGLIECTAKNDIGIQREPCRYLVVPLAGPFFPYNCAVANQSDSTLSIRCDGSIQLTNASSDPIGAVPTVYRGASEPAYDGPSDLEDTEDLEDEEVDSGPSNRIKYHNSQVLSHRRKLSENLNPQGLPLNLSTSDIYALYFAPDVDPGSQDPDADTTDGSGQRPGGTKLTYRNGIGPPGSAKMTQHQLAASANLLLNELVPKFNSYPISGSTHLFAYPPTYYICEIYAMTPRPTLIKNVTIDAVGRRIMNPFNGSFSFLVDSLPPNTPLRVNIYARNARKRSPIWVELEAQTQRAAERRIDSAQQGGPGDQESVARGRKASFFEELYGGYGRFRSKHLVVGLLIGAVAVAVFVAILLIVIASLRNKTGSSGSSGGSQERQMSMLEQHGKLSGSFKRKNSSSTSRRPSTQLNLEDFKETTFMERTEENFDDDLGKGCGQQTNVDVLGPGAAAVAVPYDSYGPYGTLDGDDDSSMRSDHQLIQQTLEPQKYYTTQTRATQQRPGPPSYFDLEQSLGAEGHPRTGGHAFVNLISPGGGHHPLEAKPDLIQTATIYSNASAKGVGDPVTTGGAIFDTISFESHGEAGGPGPGASGYEMSPMPTMIAVAAGGEQLSGNIIHFSPLRNHPSHSTLQRRYLGHPTLTDGTSPSTTLSRGSSAAGAAQQSGTTVLYEGPKQQSYIYIQHLGPELSGGPPDSTT